MNYRPDIDGLRAVAVLAVVIFHLGVPGFEGGYVGVDVFFVISGYLITSIILAQHTAGRFSFAQFYARRVRRLFPPLIATVLATTLACAAILEPYDMIAYGRSAVATLFSVSNILFFSEAGYWDSASELKPLLHTWSLGVEEQFYLLWPATIVGLLTWRGPRGLGLPLLTITAAGVALCIAYTTIDAAAAFYLLPFRVFQFALGALVVPLAATALARQLLHARWGPVSAMGAGLLLILFAVFTFDADTLFPGSAALVPSLGTALVLFAGSQWASASPANTQRPLAGLLDNPLSLWVGRASYAMYLVHWPMVALYYYEAGREPTASAQVWLAVGIVAATWLLHYGVERRFYERSTARSTALEKPGRASASHAPHSASSRSRHRGPIAAILASLLLVSVLPLSAWLGDGWSWREPDVVLTADAIKQGMQERYIHVRSACPIEELATHDACDLSRPRQVLVFGNSHEPDGFNFLHAGYRSDNVNLIRFGTTNACPGLAPEGVAESADCAQRMAALFSPEVIESLDVLFYVANKPFLDNKAPYVGILRELKRLKPTLRVITMGGYINTRTDCWRLINAARSTSACRHPANVSYFADAPQAQPMHHDIMTLTDHFVDRVDLLCPNRQLESCAMSAEDGTPAFYDRHHLSLQFASMAGRRYSERYPGLLTGK